MKPIVDRIGKPAMLEQTAEECAELAHACLKEARRLRGENPTPKTTPECWLASGAEESGMNIAEYAEYITGKADECRARLEGNP